MAQIWKKVKKILSATDYFNSSNMLRFENEDDYKTITGGIISLAIIAVIIVSFTSEILITLQRTSIQVKNNVVKYDVPKSSHVTFSPLQNQMFAVLISGFSASSPLRYFDILAHVNEYQNGPNGQSYQFTPIQMVPCTAAHWQGIQSVNSTYDLGTLFCPALGTNADLYGKLSSGKLKDIQIYITPCNPYSYYHTTPCPTTQEMDMFWTQVGGVVSIHILYINTIIAPDQPNYKTVYLQDRGYGYIGKTSSCDILLQLSQYSISTDQSIWPFPDQVQDNGLFVTEGLQIKNFPKQLSYPFFVIMRIRKSSDKYTYERKVQKLSTIFSYIGGVISSLLTAFFIMNKYTSFAFEVSVANLLFKKENAQNNATKTELAEKAEKNKQKEQQNSISMSIFLYFKYNAYNLVKAISKNSLKSQHLEYIKQCQQQMTKQLDIKRLIRRISFLQHCISNIVQKEKIKDLLITQPFGLQQLKKNRQQFQYKKEQSQIDSNKYYKQQIKINNFEPIQPNLKEQLSASELVKDKRNWSGVIKDMEQSNQGKSHLNMHETRKQVQIPTLQFKQLQNRQQNKNLNVSKLSNQEKKSKSNVEIQEIPIQFCNLQKE